MLPTEEQNELKVIASPDRAVMAWIGGSIFSSNSQSFEQFISKEGKKKKGIFGGVMLIFCYLEYDEVGPSIVHTKCPY